MIVHVRLTASNITGTPQKKIGLLPKKILSNICQNSINLFLPSQPPKTVAARTRHCLHISAEKQQKRDALFSKFFRVFPSLGPYVVDTQSVTEIFFPKKNLLIGLVVGIGPNHAHQLP